MSEGNTKSLFLLGANLFIRRLSVINEVNNMATRIIPIILGAVFK